MPVFATRVKKFALAIIWNLFEGQVRVCCFKVFEAHFLVLYFSGVKGRLEGVVNYLHQYNTIARKRPVKMALDA